MAHSSLGELIKTGKGDILSCTLMEVDPNTQDLVFKNINFRKAVEKKCGILFYEYENNIYFPYSMEFRLIDNNILHLIIELGINSFKELCDVLTSSFKREEGREVDFFGVIHEVNQVPPFCHQLKSFQFIESDELIRIKDE